MKQTLSSRLLHQVSFLLFSNEGFPTSGFDFRGLTRAYCLLLANREHVADPKCFKPASKKIICNFMAKGAVRVHSVLTRGR
jgi:hypothetical protein